MDYLALPSIINQGTDNLNHIYRDRLGRLTFITLQTVQENKDKHFVYNSNIGIHFKIDKTKYLKISYRINKVSSLLCNIQNYDNQTFECTSSDFYHKLIIFKYFTG